MPVFDAGFSIKLGAGSADDDEASDDEVAADTVYEIGRFTGGGGGGTATVLFTEGGFVGSVGGAEVE